MGMELPGQLTTPLGWLGMTWPEGDETALSRMSDYWEDYADEVTAIAEGLQQAAVGVLDSIEGDTHDALKKSLDEFFNGEKSIYEVIDDAQYLAQGAQKSSDIVLAMKISFIVELIALLAFVIAALASSPINWGAGAQITARILLGRVSLTAIRRFAVQQIRVALMRAIGRITTNMSGDAALDLLGGTTGRAIAKELAKSAALAGTISAGLEAERQFFKHTLAATEYELGKIGLSGASGAAAPLLFAKVATPLKAVTGWGLNSPAVTSKFTNDAISGATWWIPSNYASNQITSSVQNRYDPGSVDRGVGIWQDLDFGGEAPPPVEWYPGDRQASPSGAGVTGNDSPSVGAPATATTEGSAPTTTPGAGTTQGTP